MSENEKAPHGKECEGQNNNLINNQTQEQNSPQGIDCQGISPSFDFMGSPAPYQGDKGNERDFVDAELVSHFEERKNGIYFLEVDSKGELNPIWLCSPLKIVGNTSDEHSNSWGLFLEWYDLSNNLHRWAMSKSLLVGRDVTAWLGRLVDEGLQVSPVIKHKNLLSTFLSTYKSSNYLLCVNSTGWHGDVFVFPTYNVQKQVARVARVAHSNNINNLGRAGDVRPTKQSRTSEIVLQTNIANNPYTNKGSFEDWQKTLGTWARGNSRLILAICASLSAVLIEPTSAENGGFHFVGGSSTGKTSALCAGASLWGRGTSQGGFIKSWRTTDNALEGICALHNDTCLFLDELGQATGKVVAETTYMIANGQGKSRAKQDGSAKHAKTWRVGVLSTGEKGIAEKISEEGGKIQAGQTVRIIDIQADAGAGLGVFENVHDFSSAKDFSEAIKRASAMHYGHLAPLFIQKFLDDESAQGEAIKSLTDISSLCDGKDLEQVDGQVLRVAKKFMLAIIAGEMATEWGLLPWEQGEAFHAIKKIFHEWLDLRGGGGSHEDSAILEQIMLFIEQHGKSRFQSIEREFDEKIINRVGFYRRNETGGVTYFVLPQSFKSELCKGVNVYRALKLLHEKGILEKGAGNNYTNMPPVSLGEFGRKRCYILTFHEEIQKEEAQAEDMQGGGENAF